MKVYFADGPLYDEIHDIPDGTQYWDVAEPPEPPKVLSRRNAAPPVVAVTFKVQRYRVHLTTEARGGAVAMGYIV